MKRKKKHKEVFKKTAQAHLEVDHGQDLFAPLDEERRAHVQVEVGETVSFSLRGKKTTNV